MPTTPPPDRGVDLPTPALIFGGPYSNLPAAQALKAICERRQITPDRVLCTGDVVAYCGSPEATATLLREWGCHVVMGNCEQAVGFSLDDCGCGFETGSVCAALSAGWHRHAVKAVSRRNREWMRSLPQQLTARIGGLRFTALHGSFDNLSEFIFESTDPAVKQRQLARCQADGIIAGHCGIPFGQHLPAGCWLNAGVIGMPANEGRPSTWYMVIDADSDGVFAAWHRLEYDHQQAQQDMRTAGLGREYADALASGIWPSASILPAAEQARQGQALTLPRLRLGKVVSG